MNTVWQHFHCFDEHTVLCRCREQNILESYFDRIHKNFHAILGAPHDVVPEAEHYPGIFSVSAVCTGRTGSYHV